MNRLFSKRIIATLLLIIPFYATAFPKDLMYLGKPIHPACICAIRPLAGSPEPQAVYSKEINEFPYTFDAQTNTVTCEDHSEYIYIGTYKNMHLVLSYEYGKGSGVFADLGLIERHRNKIVNVGTIAAGNRGCGGTIQVEEFKDGILRYSQIFYHMG